MQWSCFPSSLFCCLLLRRWSIKTEPIEPMSTTRCLHRRSLSSRRPATRAQADIDGSPPVVASGSDRQRSLEAGYGLFHQTIVAACRNHLLIDIYDAINAVRRKADWAALKERVVTPARRGVTEKQHRNILAALRARDAQRAGLEMKNHLIDVRRSLVGS
jgi:DNA-binding GntR family transcriptional regulator